MQCIHGTLYHNKLYFPVNNCISHKLFMFVFSRHPDLKHVILLLLFLFLLH